MPGPPVKTPGKISKAGQSRGKICVPTVRFQPKLTCCAISYALEYRRPINSLLRRKKKNPFLQHGASLVAQMVKNLPARQETWVRSLGWGNPQRKKWQPTPIFLPGEFHRQRSLLGYSSRGHKGSHTIEQLTFNVGHSFASVFTVLLILKLL